MWRSVWQLWQNITKSENHGICMVTLSDNLTKKPKSLHVWSICVTECDRNHKYVLSMVNLCGKCVTNTGELIIVHQLQMVTMESCIETLRWRWREDKEPKVWNIHLTSKMNIWIKVRSWSTIHLKSKRIYNLNFK